MAWRYLKSNRGGNKPWSVALQQICRKYQSMPSAGGAYDQDPELTDAVSVIDAITMMLDLSAKEEFNLPTQQKKFYRLIKRTAENESF